MPPDCHTPVNRVAIAPAAQSPAEDAGVRFFHEYKLPFSGNEFSVWEFNH